MTTTSRLKLGAAACVSYMRQGAAEALRALLAFPLLLLLLLVLLQYGNQAVHNFAIQGAASMYTRAAMLAIGVGLVFSLVVRRKVAWKPWVFLSCSMGLTAAIYYAYISSIDVAWVSDFQTMWQHAAKLAASGHYAVDSIYDQRALPILVPLILLFGPNPAVVPLANMVLLLGVQLCGYDLARRIAGHRAAQAATVLWIGAMEPIMALPITSHDIWGLFFLVLFLWGFRATLDRLRTGWSTVAGRVSLAACALGLAAVLALLNMQRSIAPLVVLGFVLAGLVLALKGKSTHPVLKPALLLAIPIFILYGGFILGLKLGHHVLTAEQRTVYTQTRLGGYSSSLSNGTFRQGQVFNGKFFNQLDEGSRKSLVRAVPLSDLALQPIARFGNIVYRAETQARLGSQSFFYHSNAKTRWGWLVPFTRAYNVCYSILLAVLGLWLILPLLRSMESLDGLAQLAMLSVMVGALLLAGESQPRYIFPVWFILPQLVAFALVPRPEAATERPGITSVWGWDVTRGSLLLLAGYAFIALFLRLAYGESQGRILSGWQHALHGATGQPRPDWFEFSQNSSATELKQRSRDQRVVGFGDLAIVLEIPVQTRAGGGVRVEKTLCAGKDRRALDFFYYMPYQNPKATGAFRLEVRVDGKSRWSVPLPGTPDVTHAYVPDILPPDTCKKLEFDLRAPRGVAKPSWLRASRVDVYFPRLAR